MGRSALSSSLLHRAPVSGSCERCGCAHGFASAERGGRWFCCGSCAGSDRCTCGCKPQHVREKSTADPYVPARRLFAARHPDELRTPEGWRDARRAFPFFDARRARDNPSAPLAGEELDAED